MLLVGCVECKQFDSIEDLGFSIDMRMIIKTLLTLILLTWKIW